MIGYLKSVGQCLFFHLSEMSHQMVGQCTSSSLINQIGCFTLIWVSFLAEHLLCLYVLLFDVFCLYGFNYAVSEVGLISHPWISC